MVAAEPETVSEAFVAFDARGDQRCVDALVGLLHRPEPLARAAGATGLGSIRSASAARGLRAAVNDPDPCVCAASLTALSGPLDSTFMKAASEALVTQLHSADPELRVLAARALGGALGGRAVEPLLVALADDEPLVRADAAASLGRVAGPRANDALARVIDKDPVSYVREVARHSIARLARRANAQ
jgi:HEAT repeat protein